MNEKFTTMRILVTLLLCLPIMASAQTNQDSLSIKKLADEIAAQIPDLPARIPSEETGRLQSARAVSI